MSASEPVTASFLSTDERKVSTGVDTTRLPALDGLRCIAVLAVVIAHSVVSVLPLPATALGELGVSLFFVLSGFLITRSMLADEEANGKLRIANFYRRRAFRILPALCVYLAAVAVLDALRLVPHVAAPEWIASLFYYRNFTAGGWETAHLWSLSLEEQFYLFWPLLFILTRRFRPHAIGLIVLAFTVHRIHWVISHEQLSLLAAFRQLHYRTDLRADTFLIGALFSLLPKFKLSSSASAVSGCLVIPWFVIANCIPALEAFETIGTALLLGLLTQQMTHSPHSRGARLLSLRPAAAIGVGSYSIYLWQELFVGRSHDLHYWTLPGLAIVSYVSYRWIETPFLRKRRGAVLAANRQCLSAAALP